MADEEKVEPADAAMLEGFAENVRVARARLNISQARLAELSDVHRTQISLIEGGQRSPRLPTIVRLAAGLGVDPAELVKGLRP